MSLNDGPSPSKEVNNASRGGLPSLRAPSLRTPQLTRGLLSETLGMCPLNESETETETKDLI